MAIREYGSIGSKLKPDIKCSLALYVSESGIEFEILLEASWEKELKLHGLSTSIVENDFLTIKLIVYQHIQIIFFLRHVDRDVDTFTKHFDGDRLTVVLVVKEKREGLPNLTQFIGDKGEGYLHCRVTIYIIGALELDLGKKLLKGIC